MTLLSKVVTACAVAALAILAPSALAAEVAAPVVSATTLSQAEALSIFRARGLDLLIADAAVRSAEGEAAVASRIANPQVSVGFGPTFDYDASAPGCSGCSRLSVQAAIGDSGAVFDVLSGKRRLRSDIAYAALAAARLNRADASRVLSSLVKQAYTRVAVAKKSLDQARAVQQLLAQAVALAKLRYPAVITEGDLARTEVQQLRGDSDVTIAVSALRQAQAALAFLLGARTVAPDFQVDELTFSVAPELQEAGERELVALALRERPDLRARAYDRTRALAALALARRQVMPEVQLAAQYSGIGAGQDAASPGALVWNASANLPVFSQRQGEIDKANAALTVATLTRARAEAIVSAEVATSYADFDARRRAVVRMNSGLLARASAARNILEAQYKAGTASLVDFLDAQRTFISIHQQYAAHLGAYSIAVEQLEQALGVEIR
jgi:cobalt-zinc-cadmium efflux system outer membrane protein